MADNNIVESKGIYLPQDFSLNSLNFLTASGQKIELKKLMVEMSFYEDIYNFVVSGHITLLDSQGFNELLTITGNEFIEVNFSKTPDAVNGVDRIFRIYKAGPRVPTGNLNTEVYSLYFCSEELLLSEQSKVGKSYKGKKISEIVNNILTDDDVTGKLRVNKSKRVEKIEETMGVYDFIVPKIKPFEAISWLSNYARPMVLGPTGGADMLFFETKNGFNFRSLQSMYSDDVYATYKYQAENVNKNIEDMNQKMINVLDYQITKPYDILSQINSGAFANRIITLDPITRKKIVKDFSYTKYKGDSSTKELNSGSVSNELTNRTGLTQATSPESVLKVAFGNSNQTKVPYIKQQTVKGGIAKDIFIEDYVPNRTAQISLANHTTIKATIPGDPGITAGRTINFNLLTLKPDSQKRDLDKFYSGKYLVSAVRHIISSSGYYQTVLELTRDSSKTEYPAIDSNSTEWKKAINS